jgi:hypothetical protein
VVDKRKELKDFRGSTMNNKVEVSERIREYAERKGCMPAVKKVATWLKKLTGRGIGGGTAVGRNYDTLLLDVSYEDAAISINASSDYIKLKGEFVEDFKEFKAVFDKHYIVKK